MNRRIFGLETEYGVVVVPTGGHGDGPLPSVEEAVTLMFAATPNAHRTTNHFLPNGSRMYVDIGAHPEYATAECDSLIDAVASDRAGDLLLSDLVTTANTTLAERGVPGRLHLLRTNADSAGNTFGCHENYQVPRDLDFGRLTDAMTAFLVSRPVLTGCGQVVSGPGGPVYAFSTRAGHTATTTSADPTRARPLINTKDEPHADDSRWRRLHVLSGDSNIAEHSTALKLGWTCLVLDLIEAGVDVDDLVPVDPMAAMHTYNTDPTGRVAALTRGGLRLSAVEVQERFLELVTAHLQCTTGDPGPGTTARWVLDLVGEGLQAIRTQRPELVDTRLDWAVKGRVLEQYAQRHGLPLDHPRVTRIALAYHDLDPVAGLADRLRRGGHLAGFVDEAQIARAADTPPQTTRAKVRGEFVAWVSRRGLPASVNWGEIRLDRPVRPPIELPDAFAAENAQVASLMATVDAG